MGFARYRAIRIDRGLYLIEPKGGRVYNARCRINGRWQYLNCGTADYREAQGAAIRWHRGLTADRDGAETMAAAATAYLTSIASAGKRAYHTTKWEAIREFWAPGAGRPSVLVADVTSPMLLAFVESRRRQHPDLTPSTVRKDLVTIRQILKFAVARGVITQVPLFPGAHLIGSVRDNPQPWLNRDEWAHLIKVARARIADAADVRTKARRQELLDFMQFMWFTGLRVGEASALQVRDITVAYTEQVAPSDKAKRAKVPTSLIRGLAGKQVRGTWVLESVQMPYLRIALRQSKTGPRMCHSRVGALAVYQRLAKGKAPTDPLFTERHRDAFRELLIAADLRTNVHGHPRNAKCLRPTAISHWLLDKPTIPLSWLAANCGTSIAMLQQFYIKRLGLNLDGSAWL